MRKTAGKEDEPMLEVLFILIITAVACSLLGPMLVLRKMSMAADALSHSVLLGIVLAFVVVQSLDSIWLLIGASLFGVLTMWSVEELSRRQLVFHDEALAIVFPVFFSAAIVIITKFFRNTHLDVDIVLMGNPLFAPFIRCFGLPRAMVEMLLMAGANLLFLIIHYQELKISIFDPEFAKLSGIRTTGLYYVFMLLVSMTCVLAFNHVGSILVISFFTVPASFACMFTKKLSHAVAVSVIVGIVDSCFGYMLGTLWNVSISGMCSAVGMALILLGVLIRQNGIFFIRAHSTLKKGKRAGGC